MCDITFNFSGCETVEHQKTNLYGHISNKLVISISDVRFANQMQIGRPICVVRKSDVRFANQTSYLRNMQIGCPICVVRKSDVRFAVLRKSDEIANRIQHIYL